MSVGTDLMCSHGLPGETVGGGRPQRKSATFITAFQGSVLMTRFIVVDTDLDDLAEKHSAS